MVKGQFQTRLFTGTSRSNLPMSGLEKIKNNNKKVKMKLESKYANNKVKQISRRGKKGEDNDKRA